MYAFDNRHYERQEDFSDGTEREEDLNIHAYEVGKTPFKRGRFLVYLGNGHTIFKLIFIPYE